MIIFTILISMKENLVMEKSFDFALKSMELYKMLLSKNEFVLSKQFFRSATSIGANVQEASAAYSKRDFAAKMSISSKKQEKPFIGLNL